MYVRARVGVIPQTPQPRRDVGMAGICAARIPLRMPQPIPQGDHARLRARLPHFKTLKKSLRGLSHG